MKNLLLFTVLSFIAVSCEHSKKEIALSSINMNTHNTRLNKAQINDGFTLMKKYCYACHNPNTKSHDDIIAPPLEAIKRRYKRQYSNKEEFIDSLTSFIQNPSKEKSLMPGAVANFNIMPPVALDTITMQKIGTYIYYNKIEQPEWFEEHYKKMHGSDKRMRRKN